MVTSGPEAVSEPSSAPTASAVVVTKLICVRMAPCPSDCATRTVLRANIANEADVRFGPKAAAPSDGGVSALLSKAAATVAGQLAAQTIPAGDTAKAELAGARAGF